MTAQQGSQWPTDVSSDSQEDTYAAGFTRARGSPEAAICLLCGKESHMEYIGIEDRRRW